LANAGPDTRALQDWLGHRNIQHTVQRAIADAVQEFLAQLSKGLVAKPSNSGSSAASASDPGHLIQLE
jgi:hypothetical protein